MVEANQNNLNRNSGMTQLSGVGTSLMAAIAIAVLSVIVTLQFGKLAVPLGMGGLLISMISIAWLMTKPLRIVQFLFVFLPFHILFMVVLFGLLGLPEGIVRALASWKEAILAFFVLAILLGVVLSGKKEFKMSPTDILALLFIGQVILYVFIAPALGSNISLVGRLYGLRDSSMLLVCYFLGRAFNLNLEELEKLLKLILMVGAVTACLGLLEWLFLPDDFFVLLGVSNYFKDFLGVNYAGDDWGQGLPGNFWTYMGSLGYVRRSVSVYMSSQGYAITFLILMPIATYFLICWKGRKRIWMFFLLLVGLLSTITRATILSCTILFFIMAALTGKSAWVKKGIVCAISIAFLGLVFSEGVRTLVIETISFKSDSSVSHLSSWESSIDPILAKPIFGHGLSEAGQNSKRFGGKDVGEESSTLRVLGEMGGLGFLLYSGFLVAYMLEAIQISQSKVIQDRIKGLSAIGIALCIGFLLNGIATDIMSSQYTNFGTGILLGLIRSTSKNAQLAKVIA